MLGGCPPSAGPEPADASRSPRTPPPADSAPAGSAARASCLDSSGCPESASWCVAGQCREADRELAAEMLSYLGVVDGEPVTRRLVVEDGSAGAAPVASVWHAQVAQQRGLCVHQRDFGGVSAEDLAPIAHEVWCAGPRGVASVRKQLDNGDDQSPVTPMPMFPWPPVVGAKTTFAATLASGAVSKGSVAVTRVGFAERVGDRTFTHCFEVERHTWYRRLAKSREHVSRALAVYCRGAGLVRAETRLTIQGKEGIYSQGAFTLRLTGVERVVPAEFDVAPPPCRQGKCGEARGPAK